MSYNSFLVFIKTDNYPMVICIGNQTVLTNRKGNEIEKIHNAIALFEYQLNYCRLTGLAFNYRINFSGLLFGNL